MCRSVDIDSHQVANGDQPGDKKSKKKKKKSKNREYEDINEPSLTLEGENRSSKVFEDKNVEAKPSRARTLSNGLVIEELGRGKPDGKVAALGKKVLLEVLFRFLDWINNCTWANIMPCICVYQVKCFGVSLFLFFPLLIKLSFGWLRSQSTTLAS